MGHLLALTEGAAAMAFVGVILAFGCAIVLLIRSWPFRLILSGLIVLIASFYWPGANIVSVFILILGALIFVGGIYWLAISAIMDRLRGR